VTECSPREAVVVARHPLAARAGVSVMEAGGTAFDAAVAVGFAISVVDLGMCGLGGGFFMLVYRTADGRSGVIDGPVVAPALATAGGFPLDPLGPRGIYGFPAVQDRANVIGHRSVAVPGAVAGLCATRDRFGTRPLAELMRPAIEIAEAGFDLSWADIGQIATGEALLRRYPATAAIFLPGGTIPVPAFQQPLDDPPRLRQPDLAGSLRQIAGGGADAFYRGPIAQAIDAEVTRGGGWLRAADLAEYTVDEGPALERTYRGWRLVTGPDWVVLETLGVLERFDLPSMEPWRAPALHLISEASVFGHADLYAHLTRPASEPGDPGHYLTAAWLDGRAQRINPTRAVARPALFPDEGGLDRAAAMRAATAGHTTGYSCADSQGNVVSVLLTLGDPWGSGVTVPGTGILLNDQMFGYNAAPGTATSVGPRARRPVPGWPVIATGPGDSRFALSTPGGNRVLCANVQVLSHRIDHGLDVTAAIGAPRIDRGSTPGLRSALLADDALDHVVLEDLRAMGHDVWPASRSLRAPGGAPGTFAYPVALAVSHDGVAGGATDPSIPGGVVVMPAARAMQPDPVRRME